MATALRQPHDTGFGRAGNSMENNGKNGDAEREPVSDEEKARRKAEKQKRGSAEPTPERCAAKLGGTSPARYCLAKPVQGRERCKHHGGHTRRGIESPNYKHGRYSKLLGEEIGREYEKARTDPDYLSAKEAIHLTEARIRLLLRAEKTGLSEGLLKEISDLITLALQFGKENDAAGIFSTLKRMQSLVDDGLAGFTIWDDVSKQISNKTRLQESERRRQIEARQVMTYDRAIVLYDAMIAATRLVVTDAGDMSRLMTEFQRLALTEVDAISPDVIDVEVAEGTNDTD